MNEHLECGQCGSADLLNIAGTPADHSHIVVAGPSVMHTVRVTRYVCTDCGFIEEWVNSRDDLKRLKALFHER